MRGIRPLTQIKVNSEIQAITFQKIIRDMEAFGTELVAQVFGECSMGIIGENSYPWYNCFLSVVCGGNVAVPFDKGFTAEELESSIIRSNIRLLFYDERHEKLVEDVKARGNVPKDPEGK